MTRLFLICWCFAITSIFAGPQPSPRINSIHMDGDALIVGIAAPPGARKISVEGRSRVTGNVWTPRAIHRFATQVSTTTAITLRITHAEALEVLRVRSDDVDLPSMFFAGETNFTESPGLILGPIGFDGAVVYPPSDGTTGTTTGSTSTSTGDPGSGTPPPRAVVESDIWKLGGDILYFFNQYRGLQLINISDPKDPTVLGTFPLAAVGEQMYVLDSGHAVLLTHGGCEGVGPMPGDEANVIVVDPATFQPTGQIAISGKIRETRLVGNILYVASQDWRPTTNNASWEQGASIVSIDLGNPAAPVTRHTLWTTGLPTAISATDKFLFVATTSNYNQSEVRIIDISSAAGEIKGAGNVTVTGRIPDKFKIHSEGALLSVVSDRWDTTLLQPITALENFSLSNPAAPVKVGELKLGKGEQVYATRFDRSVIYIVTYRRIDPLWIVNNSDPANPTLAGELHVPGWSTYLHPMGDRLLAMGIDDTNGWRVAVSLFDVANPAAPALLSKVIMGSNYSWSEANADEKALTVLPEKNLLLAPWNDGAGYRMQLIDFDRDNLTARGALTDQINPRRATLLRDHIVSISGTDLVTYDAVNRDQPRIAGKAILSWSVKRAVEVGDYLLQFEDCSGHANASLRVTPKSAVDRVLDVATFESGYAIAGVEHRDGKFYAALRRSSDGLRMVIYDTAALPKLRKLSEAAIPNGQDPTPNVIALWPKPGLLVWAAAVAPPPPSGPVYGTSTSAGILTGTTTGWPEYDPTLISGAYAAFDVSNPTAPQFLSNTQLNRRVTRSFTHNGLIYTSYRSVETVPISGQLPEPVPAPDTFSQIVFRYITGPFGAQTFSFALADGKFTITEYAQGVGSYNYSKSGPYQAHIRFNYQGNLNGDFDDLDLDFRTGAFVGAVNVSGTFGAVSGTFAIPGMPPPGATLPPPPMTIAKSYLTVIDFADPDEPVVRAPVQIPGALVGVSDQGRILYTIGHRTNTFDVQLSASAYDGLAAYLLDAVPASPPYRATVNGSDVFLLETDQSDAVQRLHLSDAGKFEKLATIPMNRRIWGLDFRGDLALVALGDRVASFDVTDRSNWKLKDAYVLECIVAPEFENVEVGANGTLWIPLRDFGVAATNPTPP